MPYFCCLPVKVKADLLNFVCFAQPSESTCYYGARKLAHYDKSIYSSFTYNSFAPFVKCGFREW